MPIQDNLVLHAGFLAGNSMSNGVILKKYGMLALTRRATSTLRSNSFSSLIWSRLQHRSLEFQFASINSLYSTSNTCLYRAPDLILSRFAPSLSTFSLASMLLAYFLIHCIQTWRINMFSDTLSLFLPLSPSLSPLLSTLSSLLSCSQPVQSTAKSDHDLASTCYRAITNANRC